MPRRDSEVYPKRKPLKDFTSRNDGLKLIPIIPSSAHFVEMDERKGRVCRGCLQEISRFISVR